MGILIHGARGGRGARGIFVDAGSTHRCEEGGGRHGKSPALSVYNDT